MKLKELPKRICKDALSVYIMEDHVLDLNLYAATSTLLDNSLHL